MELEALGILGNTVLILAGGIVALVKTRNKNNKLSQDKFDEQVHTCTERFLNIADGTGQVRADIKSIKESIKSIEKKIEKGLNTS